MKKLFNYTVIISILILSISSCRYTIPLVKFRIANETTKNENTRTVNREYVYFRISRYGFLGEGNYSKTYTNGELDSILITKHYTHRMMRDGIHTRTSKTIKYKTDNLDSSKTGKGKDAGHIQVINMQYTKKYCKGYYKKEIIKTIYFNSNLKKRKVVTKNVNSK